MGKHALLLGAATAALFANNAALAQATSGDTSTSVKIETVVVTGERRTENLMTTPITASVISGQDIATKDVVNVNSLQFVAPNLTVNDLGQGIDFEIRGIGKDEHNTQTPAGVVTYRDGVSTFPGYLTEEPYFDIKSVEVYRGPQGTFVGQNATGGAVFVTTNDPTLGGGYDGYAQAQYGNYQDVELQGAVDIPVTDNLALRVAGFGEARSGMYGVSDTDPADNCPHNKYAGCKPGYNPGDRRWGVGRITALWRPINPLTITVKFDADYLDNGAAFGVPYSQLQPVGAITQPLGVTNPYHSDLFHPTSNAPAAELDRMDRTILKAEYDFADGTKLQSISDYNVGNIMWTLDLDGTSYGNPTSTPYFGSTKNWTLYDRVDETIYSEELDLISPDDQPVTWVVGLYGQSNLYTWLSPYQFWVAVGQRFPGGPTPNAGNFYQYTSYTFQGNTNNLDLAGFGQVDAKLGGGFAVSLGGRWTETRSKNNVTFFEYGGKPYGTPYIDHQGQKSYNLSYKAALDWMVDPGDFLYAFVATGYTGGGLNTPVSTPTGSLYLPSPFGDETDTDYEAGWKKSDLFGGHVRTELNAFYTTYNHFQVSLANPITPTENYEFNAPKPTNYYGFEADVQASFGHLSVSGNLGLLHSEIGTLYAVDGRLGTGAGTCDQLSGGTNPHCQNITGNPQTYAPTVTYDLSAQYVFDLAGGDTLTPRINFSHTSGQWSSVFDNAALGDRLNVRNLLGAQLEWTRGDWDVTLYGTNLTNDEYVTANNGGLLFSGPPRQFGIRLLKVF